MIRSNFVEIGLLCGFLVLGCCSCQKSSETVVAVESIVTSLAPEISPGDRPKSIRNGRYFAVGDFVTAVENKEVSKGELVCVEGHVQHAGERMGAAYLTMVDAADKVIFSCEGDGLRRYQIAPGINVIVHGRVEHVSFLADSSLITQQEVDVAYAEENSPEQP